MAEAIEIRRATAEDAPVIAAVLYESFVEYRDLYTDDGFAATILKPEQIVKRVEEGPVWIAWREGAAVGTVATVAKERSAYIRGMAVLPSARGLGVGSALLREVEGWALRENFEVLFLSTTPFLHSAIGLYEKFGYRRREQAAQDLFGTPLFVMEKPIQRRASRSGQVRS
jgi:ribosomal protein S18 acetylase RimI-like enzyme